MGFMALKETEDNKILNFFKKYDWKIPLILSLLFLITTLSWLNKLAWLFIIWLFYILIKAKGLTLIGGIITFYALLYNAISSEHSARIGVIADTTRTAMQDLKELKDGSLALEATLMKLLQKPMPWEIWSVFSFYQKFKNLNSTEHDINLRLEVEYIMEEIMQQHVNLDIETAKQGVKYIEIKTPKVTIYANIKDIKGNTIKKIKIEKTDDWNEVYRSLELRVETIRDIRARVETLAKNYGFVPKKVSDIINNRIERLIFIKDVYTLNNIIDEEFKKININEAKLSGLWLQGANLQHANLQGANLFDIKLQGANLSSAHLNYANLIYGQFTGADFTNSNLNKITSKGANFQGADLSRANLTEAWLFQAILRNTNLANTFFNYADIGYCEFQDSHMYNTTLLEHIEQHNGIRTDLGFPDFTGVQNLHTAIFHDDKVKNRQIIKAIAKRFKIHLPEGWKQAKYKNKQPKP
jgi:uncharacterized protein YjbI with pentapeptide repeats